MLRRKSRVTPAMTAEAGVDAVLELLEGGAEVLDLLAGDLDAGVGVGERGAPVALCTVLCRRDGELGEHVFELGEGGAEVLDDLGGDDVGVGEGGGVFEALVADPEEVEADLVALEEL